MNNSPFFSLFPSLLFAAARLLLVLALFFQCLFTTTLARYADQYPDIFNQEAPLNYADTSLGHLAPPAIKKNLKIHFPFILTESFSLNRLPEIEPTVFFPADHLTIQEFKFNRPARAPPLS